MQLVHKPVIPISATNRSRVSNETLLLEGIDGRSAPARRFRDLIRAYEEEFDVASEADKTLIRSAEFLRLKLEAMQAAQVRGENVDSDEIVRMSGELCRVLGDLKRKAQAQAPTALSLHDHPSNHAAEEDGG